MMAVYAQIEITKDITISGIGQNVNEAFVDCIKGLVVTRDEIKLGLKLHILQYTPDGDVTLFRGTLQDYYISRGFS